MEAFGQPDVVSVQSDKRKDDLSVAQNVDGSPADSTNRWEGIKPEFMRLYIEEGKSLDKVRQELRERCNFKASKSAFTRQINIWKCFKNVKASEARHLVAQRRRGQRPELDSQGRPVPWDRVFRATRSRTAAQRLKVENCRKALVVATRPQLPPIDYDSRVVALVSNIWRASTKRFASQNPSTHEYQAQYDKYHCLIRWLDIISMSSDSLWPNESAQSLSKEMYDLIKQQPAMACEVFIFLIKRDPADTNESVRRLKNHLFKYIRELSEARLQENNSLRKLLWSLDDRESYTRLGGAIAKAKLDAMWKTSTKEIGQRHHQRTFFRQVLMKAVLVMSEYGDSRFTQEFLPELSKPYERVDIEPQVYDTPAELSSSFNSPADDIGVAKREGSPILHQDPS